MFGRNKYNKNQKFFNAETYENFGKDYEKGLMTKEQYLNSMALLFARMVIYNEGRNESIIDDSKYSLENADKIKDAVKKVEIMENPNECNVLDKMDFFMMGQINNNRTTNMDAKKMTISSVGVLIMAFKKEYPDISSTEIFEDIFRRLRSEDAILFSKNNKDYRLKTTSIRTKIDPETLSEYEYVHKEYQDYVFKRSIFRTIWLMGERMCEMIENKGDLDFNDADYFDEDGFVKDKNGYVIEEGVSKAFKNTVIIDTKGFERLLFQ